jgi:transposase
MGYAELQQWCRTLGEVHAFGIEGTGSYGAGVARFLANRGYAVVEVNRPDRSTRRRKGKSDPTDAEMAARAVLAGVANATPKSGGGEVEMIRMLKNTEGSAVKARTQAINQMKALVVTAPAELRETLSGLASGAWAAGAPPSDRALWVTLLQQPSTLSVPWPAAIANSLRRSRT